VEPLLLVSREFSLTRDIQQVALDSIRSIQEQLSGGEAGGLSVVAGLGTSGALSVADGDGALSLSEPASRD
jgi:hypothetical protein